jgi:hypothetical protein
MSVNNPTPKPFAYRADERRDAADRQRHHRAKRRLHHQRNEV